MRNRRNYTGQQCGRHGKNCPELLIIQTIPAPEKSAATHGAIIVGKSAIAISVREDVSPLCYPSSIRKMKPSSSQTFILPWLSNPPWLFSPISAMLASNASLYRDVTVNEFFNLLHTTSITISHLVTLMCLQQCLSVPMLVSH